MVFYFLSFDWNKIFFLDDDWRVFIFGPIRKQHEKTKQKKRKKEKNLLEAREVLTFSNIIIITSNFNYN